MKKFRRRHKKNEEKSYKGIENYLKRKLNCPITIQKIKIPHKEIDVIGYNPVDNVFCAVERKPGKSVVKLGQALGQILTYQSLLTEGGQEFLINFQDEIEKNDRRQIDPGKLSKNRLRFKFYVAVDDDVCRNFKLLQWLKERIPHIGFIRMNGKRCESYIKNDRGEKDERLSEAKVVKIPFITFERKLWKLLEELNVTENVKQITFNLVDKIKKMEDGIEIKYFSWGFKCTINKVFANVYIRRKYIILSLYRGKRKLTDRHGMIKKNKPKWADSKRITSEKDSQRVEPLFKQALKLRQKT